MKHWYAVHCKPRQDERAEAHLRSQGFEIFRPLVRARRRQREGYRICIESMFPRYLFIRLDDIAEDWSPIRSTRGVADLVRWGGCVPWIPERVIDDLRARLDANGCVDLCPEFAPNQRVRITEGPFAGYEALFQARSGQERVVVLLNIMQQTQRVQLPEQAIARV